MPSIGPRVPAAVSRIVLTFVVAFTALAVHLGAGANAYATGPRVDFQALGYKADSNAYPNSPSPGAVCDREQANVQPGSDWTWSVQQEAPGRWRCQASSASNPAVAAGFWFWVVGQCTTHQASPPTGAPWATPGWDQGSGTCYCGNANDNGWVWDGGIQWCVAATPVCVGDSCTDPNKYQPCKDGECRVANPIGPAFGAKEQRETDVAGDLGVVRNFNGLGFGEEASGGTFVRKEWPLFGRRWASEYTTRLFVTGSKNIFRCMRRLDNDQILCPQTLYDLGDTLAWRRADGTREQFLWNGTVYSGGAETADADDTSWIGGSMSNCVSTSWRKASAGPQ